MAGLAASTSERATSLASNPRRLPADRASIARHSTVGGRRYVRLMAPEPSMLELLRSRLTDLEARQRATGGAAEHGFWERFAGRMPSAPAQPTAGSAPSDHSGRPAGRTAGTGGWAGSAFTPARDQPAGAGRPTRAERPARAGATARPVAPAARPQARPGGPWTDIAPEAL